MDQIYVLVLRLVHVFGGVFWAGSALFFAGFLTKAVKAAGPDGGKVMGRLITDTAWARAIASASGLTMLSGILLYVRQLALDNWTFNWAQTGSGIGFTIGGLTGIAAGIIGGAVLGRASARLAELGAELQKSAGGPPPAEKLAEVSALQERMDRFTNINAILITISVILMGISQYLP